ncbi:hypothetical protein [Clostridium tetani]|uniref:hypothetical protein n=1 Tax=Clostridium tetani TaxID=1513 RepID=UPI002952BADC|nr:hypothetical protein [Clostridium tetani]BDR84900.1 hypothetical protein K254310026_23110 [Clostridium tetani]
MDKKLFKKIQERYGSDCLICSSNYLVEYHHIIHGNGKRKECETEYSVIPLCWNCHKGNNGVHGKNGRKLDLKLKKKLQRKYFKLGYEESKVRELMGGKLY